MLRTVLITSVLVACTQSDEPGLETTELQLGCPIATCGNNSPLLGPFRADELNEAGLANTSGLRLLGFVGRPGASPCTDASPCRVDVREDDLIVLVPSATAPNGYVERTGSALTGGYLLVWQPGDPNYNPSIPAGNARIIINTWSKVTTFWQGANGPIVDTYQLLYEIPGHSRGAVCGTPPSATDGEGNQWQRRLEAIFFTGDRYDHERMTVTAASYADSGDWFNIACAGSATMKLHLNRHTTASATTATSKQRQAMLKMFSGDFCGDGTTYTVHGTKLQWATNTGVAGPVLSGINSFESYWNEDGAVCMTRHRLESSMDPELAKLGKIIREGSSQLPATCRKMPVCSRLHSNNYLGTQSAALP
jgi:hypothetical protein